MVPTCSKLGGISKEYVSAQDFLSNILNIRFIHIIDEATESYDALDMAWIHQGYAMYMAKPQILYKK